MRPVLHRKRGILPEALTSVKVAAGLLADFGVFGLTFSWVARLTVRMKLGRSRYTRLVSEWLRVFEDAGLKTAATKA